MKKLLIILAMCFSLMACTNDATNNIKKKTIEHYVAIYTKDFNLVDDQKTKIVLSALQVLDAEELIQGLCLDDRAQQAVLLVLENCKTPNI